MSRQQNTSMPPMVGAPGSNMNYKTKDSSNRINNNSSSSVGAINPVISSDNNNNDNNHNNLSQNAAMAAHAQHQTTNTTNQPQNSGQAFSQADLNRIVLEYLTKKGYNRNEAMLRMESSRIPTLPPPSRPIITSFSLAELSSNSVTAPKPASTLETDKSSISTQDVSSGGPTASKFNYGLSHSYTASELLDHYARANTLLNNWISSLLELYQSDLQGLRYPIFLYTYINLLISASSSNDSLTKITNTMALQIARTFFRIFSKTFLISHSQELTQLQSASASTMVSTDFTASDLFKTLTETKYKLSISKASADSLIFFLYERYHIGGLVILKLIYQYIDLTVSSLLPKTSADVELVESELKIENGIKVEAMDIDDAESTEPLANPISTLNNTMGKLDNAIDVAIEFEKAVEARKNIVLNRVQSPLPSICMYTFHDTNETLNCIEFSPDSNLAASGFSDSFIKVWNLKGKPLQSVVIDDEPSMNKRLKGHSGAVFGLDFSPDNRYLLSCSEDRTVRLWSMETFTNLVSYKSHNQPIWDVAFSPNGQHFATASHDQTARLWSCDRMYPLRIMAGHMSDVDCVTFHPNGKYLLTGSSDKTCRMWDVNSGSPVRVMLGHMGPINCTSVSPDGRWLASAGEDSVVNIWDLGSGRRLKSMRGHGKASIYSLTWSADGSVLLSSGADNSVRVWDVKHNTIEAGPEPEPFNAGETSASGEMDNKGVGSKNPTLVDADGKKKKEIVSTPDHMGVYFTRKTPVYKVHLTSQNLCLAAGSYFGE